MSNAELLPDTPDNWLTGVGELVKMAATLTDSRGGNQGRTETSRGNDEPTINLLDELIEYAVRRGASDLHLEPYGEEFRARYAIDGVLIDVVKMPGRLGPGLLSRVKHLAKLKLSETRHPQKEQFVQVVDGHEFDVRVQTALFVDGEGCVLRIHDRARAMLGLDELGMDDSTLAEYRKMAQAKTGMFIVSGPVGGGKTTTIHATLLDIDTEGQNVITIEDPVDSVFPQFQQFANVGGELGISFLDALRVALRLNPNIIFVGEIRDQETAWTALNAALASQKVFSTTHSPDSTTTLLRLAAMNIEPFLLAHALKAIVAQRLVRTICDNCREPLELDPVEMVTAERLVPGKTDFTYGRGCKECNGTGFGGRRGVYEFLKITPDIAKLISTGAEEELVRETAIAEGMITLDQGAIRLVREDKTTLSEVLREVLSQ